ncbi:hypothetical protein D3C87_2168540 [compost metagenome]
MISAISTGTSVNRLGVAAARFAPAVFRAVTTVAIAPPANSSRNTANTASRFQSISSPRLSVASSGSSREITTSTM